MNEDQALAVLQSAHITAETLAQFAKNPALTKSRKVRLALAIHPRTPRHVAIPLLRRLFTFDLMRVTLSPAAAADIKRVAEEQMLNRLEALSAGGKISLARRASGRVAAALLGDPDIRILSAALDNPRLVEVAVVSALMSDDATTFLFIAVSEHPKWAHRREIQIALLKSEKLPLERARKLAGHFAPGILREILPESRRAELAGEMKKAD